MRKIRLNAIIALYGGLLALPVAAQNAPRVERKDNADLRIVHSFQEAMPVGIAVSRTGRMFVSYPRWEDPLTFTLAELKDGKETPFPEGGTYQQGNRFDPQTNLVSLQGLRMDSRDRLWVLDTSTVNMQPVQPFSPKIVCYNLQTGREELKFRIPGDVAPEGTYLNDLRIDLTRGTKGMIYITDSGQRPGILVFDIGAQKAWRRLADHPSVKPEEKFMGFPEGRALFRMPTPERREHLKIGSDGIALSPDGKTLYYTPLASRRLFSVSCDALVDPAKPEEEVAATVRDLGEKGVADGLEEDTQGNVYITNWEQNAIIRRRPNGMFETVVHDERLLWPDTLALTEDGYLYILSNQLHRQPGYNAGKDLRKKPYILGRVKTDTRPVALGPGNTAQPVARRDR
ncbi:MAG: L-dopachrome tautomerase-related protein [Capsulimonadales bacterium]|nr:L-dopachrome tautomerase-related protein [Capsulimonadales bacterium]